MKHLIRPILLDADIESLLAANGLPTSDLRASYVHLFGCRGNGRFIGIVGLERYGNVALLRSLAVVNTARGTGLGAALVAHAEKIAADCDIEAIYLLTTTAAGFFSRCGYHNVPRDTAPSSIAATSQFSVLCPSSSAFMTKNLSAGQNISK